MVVHYAAVARSPQTCYQPRLHPWKNAGRQPGLTFAPRNCNLAHPSARASGTTGASRLEQPQWQRR
jgi:hypothetical protein